MQTIHNEDELQAWVQENRAAMLLFGGANCSVCQAIKPRLQKMLAEEFPNMHLGYVACDGEGSSLCASYGLFSIPIVWLYFEGKRASSFGRVFSLDEVRAAIQRSYGMMFG